MKKTAQLIKNHISGKKTKKSIEILSKICNQLKKVGFKSPFKFKKIAQIDSVLFVFDGDDAELFNQICLADKVPDFEKDFPYFTNWIGENITVKIKTFNEPKGEHFGTPVEEPVTEAFISPQTIQIDFSSVMKHEDEDCIPLFISTKSSEGERLTLTKRTQKGNIFSYEVELD